MQGRLSATETRALQEFPRLGWEEEFPRAAAAGLSAIEWLYDDDGLGVNPLETDAGIARMRDLSAANGIEVRSLCAHWFVQHPLRHEGFDRLELVLTRCAAAGIERIVVPFLEAGAIEHEGVFATTLRRALASAERSGTELLLESSLEPGRLAAVLDGLAHPLLGVNYDSGHAAPSAIAALGPGSAACTSRTETSRAPTFRSAQARSSSTRSSKGSPRLATRATSSSRHRGPSRVRRSLRHGRPSRSSGSIYVDGGAGTDPRTGRLAGHPT